MSYKDNMRPDMDIRWRDLGITVRVHHRLAEKDAPVKCRMSFDERGMDALFFQFRHDRDVAIETSGGRVFQVGDVEDIMRMAIAFRRLHQWAAKELDWEGGSGLDEGPEQLTDSLTNTITMATDVISQWVRTQPNGDEIAGGLSDGSFVQWLGEEMDRLAGDPKCGLTADPKCGL